MSSAALPPDSLPAIKDELKRWKASFLHSHGYKPERSDYLASELRSKFMRFEELEAQRRAQASTSSSSGSDARHVRGSPTAEAQ